MSLLTVHSPPTSTSTVFLNRTSMGKKFDDFPVQTRPKWGWWSREVTRMTATIMKLPGTFWVCQRPLQDVYNCSHRIFALHMKERVRKPPMSRKSESQHLATHKRQQRAKLSSQWNPTWISQGCFFFELYIFSACISSRSSFPAPRIIPLTKTKNRPTSYLGSAICFQWFNHIFCSFDLVWNISLLPRPSCLEYPSCALSSGKSSMHLCFVGGLWKLLTANTCRHACMVIKCWS